MFITIFILIIFLILLHILSLFLSTRAQQSYKSLRLNTYTLSYKEISKESPNNPNLKEIVLIHGMFSNFNCWDIFLNETKIDGRFISLDLPQTGFSITKGLATPVDSVEDVIYEFCKKLNLKSPVLVGSSLGGVISFLCYKKYPDYFEKCIVVSSPFSDKILPFSLKKLVWFVPVLNLFVNLLPILWMHKKLSQKNFSLKKVFQIIVRFKNLNHFSASLEYTDLIKVASKDLSQTSLDKIKNVYFIWGDKDHLVRNKHIKPLISKIPDFCYYEIKGGSHHPMESHPVEFSAIIQKILDQGA